MDQPYYVDNTISSAAVKFWNWLFGSKEEHIIDAVENQVAIAPSYNPKKPFGITWNDLGAGANTVYNKDGSISLDRPLKPQYHKMLKTALYSKFNSDPDDLNDGLKKYFFYETGIKPKDWDTLSDLGKIDNFQYGLHRMISRDSLKDFEDKKQKALTDKNLSISDEEELYFSKLKSNYDLLNQEIDWDSLTEDYMYQASRNVFGTNKNSKTTLSKLGSVAVEGLFGALLGKYFGPWGAAIGGIIGTAYGAGKGFYDYVGEGGDQDSYAKSARDIETMLEDYYNSRLDLSQVTAQYREFLNTKTDTEKQELALTLDEIASKLAPRYEQYLKNNLTVDLKLDLLAEFYANSQLLKDSSYAGIKLQRNILNLAVDRLGFLDYSLNTVALFTDSFSGQLIRAAGMIYGIAGAPGLDNDPEHEEDGYWNNIIDNDLTRYGDNIATLHKWSPAEQQLYKQKGWVDNEILMRPGEENDILNLKSIPEVLGQYGFTAGSMLISKLGSKLVTKLGKIGQKGIDKAFIADNSTKAVDKYLSRTKWLEKTEDLGHLGIAGATGTIEGGLEASLTYDEAFRSGMKQYNTLVDNESKNILKEKTTQELMDIYKQMGGKKELTDFISFDETGTPSGINNSKLVDEIMALNATNTESNPLNNVLAKLLGNVPDKEVIKKILEAAWTGAYVDFWINSLINGYIHTTFKLGQLSKYARRAKDRLFGNDIKKQVDITYENGRPKATGKEVTKRQLIGERLIEALGEGMEEYFQELANAFGRGLVEDDILAAINDKYANRSEKAVVHDFATNLSTALSRTFDRSLSVLAVKSYMYGALSTFIGGVTVNNNRMTQEEVQKYDGNFFDRLGNKSPIVWRTGLSPLFTNAELNKRNAENQQVAESLNKFFGNKDKLDLFFNTVASITHGKIADIVQPLGDDALDSEKSKALINAVVNAYRLRGTLYGDSVSAALRGRTAWSKYVQRDKDGKAIQSDTMLQEAYIKAVNSGNTSEIARIKEMLNAVNEFLVNADDATKAKVGTTQNEIIAEISKNAEDTLAKIDEVGKLYESVNREFGREVSDDVKEAYVKTMLERLRTEDEFVKLREQYKDVLASLPDVENGTYRNRNGFTAEENNILIRYKNLESILKDRQEKELKLKEAKERLKEELAALKGLLKEDNPNDMRIAILSVAVNIEKDAVRDYEESIAKLKNAAGIMREMQTKAKNLGYSSIDAVKFSIGDMVNLDSRSLWLLLNEKNEDDLSEDLKVIVRAMKLNGEAANPNFTTDIQRMDMLLEKLDNINKQQYLFRSNPKYYLDYESAMKEAKARDYVKDEYSDLFIINESGKRTTDDDKVEDVTPEEFNATLDKILNDKSGTDEERQRRKDVILQKLEKLDKAAKAKGKTTLYGRYKEYQKAVNEDIKKMRKTGYFSLSEPLTKKLISALVKYARSIGKKFNVRFNDFAEGGLVLHADDVFSIGNEYVEEFKQHMQEEGIPEKDYNTNEFKEDVRKLLSDVELDAISEALNEIDKVEEKPEVKPTATPTPTPSTPTPLNPEAQKQENQEGKNIRGQIADILNKALSNIDAIKDPDGVTKLSQLLEAVESLGNDINTLYRSVLSVLHNFATNPEFTLDEKNYWWDILNEVKDLQKPINTQLPVIDTSVPSGTMAVTITPPAFSTSSDRTVEDLINELIAKYMLNASVGAALKQLLEYHNAGNDITVSFIIDDSLNQGVEALNGKPVVSIAVKVTKAMKKAGVTEAGTIKIGNSKYKIIGVITDKTRGAEQVINKAIEQRNKQGKNKKSAVVKVKGKELVSNSVDVVSLLNSTSSTRNSIFSQFLRSHRNVTSSSPDITPTQAQFIEFLRKLYKVQREEEVIDEETGEKTKVKRLYWVYREQFEGENYNNDPQNVYDYVEGDVLVTPAKIQDLTYTDGETIKRITDFFRDAAFLDYTLIENATLNHQQNDLFLFLTQLFGDSHRRNVGGELNSTLKNISDEDFDEDGVLNDIKTKAIKNTLGRYFYWNMNYSFRVIRGENGFLEALIYTTGEEGKIITLFVVATPLLEGLYTSDLNCGYSFMHNMLNPRVANNNLQFGVQLSYNTVKDAIIQASNNEEIKTEDTKKSFDRIFDLIVKKHGLFTTNKENFKEQITKINVTIDEKTVTTITDDISNPEGTDPNLTRRGTNDTTGQTNGQKDDPPAKDQHVKNVANQMLSDSELLNLTEDEDAYESTDGSFRGTRVTAAIKQETDVNDAELTDEELDETLEDVYTPPLFFGNCFDSLCEQVFLFSKGLDLLNMTDELLYLNYAVAKEEVDDFKRLVNQMIQLKAYLEQKFNCKFVEGRVKTKCTIKNTDTGRVFNVAGTLDLIARPLEDGGKWKIFDIKTMHIKNDSDMDAIMLEIEKKQDYWGDQLGTYARSLSASYPGVEFDVAKNIVLPLVYDSSLNNKEAVEGYTEEKRANSYSILRNEDGSVVTGWVGKWFLPQEVTTENSEDNFGALPIIITEGDMRDNGTFWNNHKIANGEEVTEEQGDTEELYSYSFGTVEANTTVEEDDDDDVLGFAALGATMATNTNTTALQEWNKETLLQVRDGSISLIIEGKDGRSTVISPEKFNHLISLRAQQMGISEDEVLDAFSTFTSELAKALIENEKTCAI